MTKLSHGPKVKKRTLFLLAILIRYANYEIYPQTLRDLECRWEDEDTSHPKLVVRASIKELENLSQSVQPESPLSKREIKESLYILKNSLQILNDNRTKRKGTHVWLFTLKLYSKDEKRNINLIDFEWERARGKKIDREVSTESYANSKGVEKFPTIRNSKKSTLTVFTTLESRFPYPLPSQNLEEDFFNWLEESFYEKYKIKVSIVRSSDHAPEITRILTVKNSEFYYKHYDVLLGGPPEIHGNLSNQASLLVNPENLKIPPGAVGEGKRWIGCYLVFLGIIWNSLLTDVNWTPYLFEDLLKLPPQESKNRLPYTVPIPGESSSSYALHFALNPLKENLGDSSITTATHKYSSLIRKGYISPRGSFPPTFIEKGIASAGITWLNDAVWSAAVLKQRYFQLRAWLPENSIPSIGCISVFNRPDGNPNAAQAFVDHFLSDLVQEKHYQLQRRVPIRKDVRDRVLSLDQSSYSKSISDLFCNIERQSIPLGTWDLLHRSKQPKSWKRDYLPSLARTLNGLLNQDFEFLDITSDGDNSRGWKLSE
jgi:ABC-type Fe3+ transport system substrate-binding protein